MPTHDRGNDLHLLPRLVRRLAKARYHAPISRRVPLKEVDLDITPPKRPICERGRICVMQRVDYYGTKDNVVFVLQTKKLLERVRECT